jgi:hypothetical protein
MSILRALFFLLILANLIFFAWAQGYFGADGAGREPQRMDQQLHPEKLRIKVREQAPVTVTKKPPANVCRTVSDLLLAEAPVLTAALEAEGWEVKSVAQAGAPQLVVLIPELVGKVLAEKKASELRLLGVTDFTLTDLTNGRYEIVLGRFDTTAAAQELLQALIKKNVKSARLDTRGQPSLKTGIEVKGPADALTTRFPALVAPYVNAVASTANADCGA